MFFDSFSILSFAWMHSMLRRGVTVSKSLVMPFYHQSYSGKKDSSLPQKPFTLMFSLIYWMRFVSHTISPENQQKLKHDNPFLINTLCLSNLTSLKPCRNQHLTLIPNKPQKPLEQYQDTQHRVYEARRQTPINSHSYSANPFWYLLGLFEIIKDYGMEVYWQRWK